MEIGNSKAYEVAKEKAKRKIRDDIGTLKRKILFGFERVFTVNVLPDPTCKSCRGEGSQWREGVSYLCHCVTTGRLKEKTDTIGEPPTFPENTQGIMKHKSKIYLEFTIRDNDKRVVGTRQKTIVVTTDSKNPHLFVDPIILLSTTDIRLRYGDLITVNHRATLHLVKEDNKQSESPKSP